MSDGLPEKINNAEFIIYDVEVIFKNIYRKIDEDLRTIYSGGYIQLDNVFRIDDKDVEPFFYEVYDSYDDRQLIINRARIINDMKLSHTFICLSRQVEDLNDYIKSFYNKIKVPQNILYFSRSIDDINTLNKRNVSTVHVKGFHENNFCDSSYQVITDIN